MRGQFDYDSKARVRCPHCGGTFEHLGGFGAFTIPGGEPHARRERVRFEGSYPSYMDRSRYEDEGWREDSQWTIQTPEEPSSGCNTCCGVCCFCIFMNFLIGIILWIVIGGPFWFWWWF